jgi:serine/threonine-protein kinase
VPRPDDGLIGLEIGPYAIVSSLGAGATAAVLRARHRMLDKDFALKLFPPEVGRGGVQRERFMREAKALSAIDHPNVVRLTDFGITEAGRPYLVMEWVDGESLHDLSSRGRISLDRAIEIGRGVLAGLVAIHRAGAVHRDLKPANIMIEGLGPKVVDLGLVCGDPATFPQVTSPNTVLGTPLYMAPEAIESASVDGRADLYALGLILYEMVTGRHPMPPATTLELLRHQLQLVPPALEPAYGELGRAIDRMVAKAPEARPTAAEVMRVLEDAATSSSATRVAMPSLPDTAVFPAPLHSGHELTPVRPLDLTRSEEGPAAIGARTAPMPPPVPHRRSSRWMLAPFVVVTIAAAAIAHRLATAEPPPDPPAPAPAARRRAPEVVAIPIPAVDDGLAHDGLAEDARAPRVRVRVPERRRPPPARFDAPEPMGEPPVSKDLIAARLVAVGRRIRALDVGTFDERYFDLAGRNLQSLDDREVRDLLLEIDALDRAIDAATAR